MKHLTPPILLIVFGLLVVQPVGAQNKPEKKQAADPINEYDPVVKVTFAERVGE